MMHPSGLSNFRLAVILGLMMSGALTVEGCYIAMGKCPHSNVTFWLRTRDMADGMRLTYDTLTSAPLEEGKPLVVLIHGFTGHRLYSPNMELVPAYLSNGGYNVLSVDWGKMASIGCYIHAALNTQIAGRCTAAFLQQLYEVKGEHWKKETHVIGFSLGAHVAGVVGYNLPGLPRITGLDPALPLFTTFSSRAEYRLDKTDAQFVDAYHTNAGWKGQVPAVGHVDFYINNARIQPGCFANTTCDHVRAVEIFAESINSKEGFFGVPCTVGATSFLSWVLMEACPEHKSNRGITEVLAGEFVNTSAKGTYKLDTNYWPPYAQGPTDQEKSNNSKFFKFF